MNSIIKILVVLVLLWISFWAAFWAIIAFIAYSMIKAWTKQPQGSRNFGSFTRSLITGCGETIKKNISWKPKEDC